MPGLGLDGFQSHARLPQTGEAGVPQLMAGQMIYPGSTSSAVDDLIQPRRRQRSAPAWSLQHDEQLACVSVDRTLMIKITSEAGEEAGRNRNQPLVSTLAVGDEDTALTRPEIIESQPQNLAAS